MDSTEEKLKIKRTRWRNKEYRKCKKCTDIFNLNHFVWRLCSKKNNREYCTNMCTNCHPDFNTMCTKCLTLKPNNVFHKHQLTRKSAQECKTCAPWTTSEQSKLRAKLYRQRPDRRKAATESAKRNNRQRRKTDIQFRLKCNLRGRLYSFVKGKTKIGSAIRDLGCTVEYLKLHLEKQFKLGMSWENYGKKEGQWSIDHILPLSKFDLTDRQQFIKVCHFSNLQPLWHVDNIRKGNKSNL